MKLEKSVCSVPAKISNEVRAERVLKERKYPQQYSENLKACAIVIDNVCSEKEYRFVLNQYNKWYNNCFKNEIADICEKAACTEIC